MEESVWFMEILKAFVHRQTPEAFSAISVEEIVKIAKMHNMTGIVYHVLRNVLAEEETDAVQAMKDQYLLTIYQSVLKEGEVNLFVDALEREQIPYAFFKGYELKELYPVPELRTMGDVDLLVKGQDMKRVSELLKNLGYERKGEGNTVWIFQKGILSFEVHRKLAAGNYWNGVDYESYFEKAFNGLQTSGGGSRRYFSVEDHFIFLCFHLAKHLNSSGAGIRMVMDIALYLQRYQKEMNWQYIQKECEEIHLDVFVRKLVYICRVWFEVETAPEVEAEPVEDEALQQLREYILSGGTFGFEREDSIRRLRKGMEKGTGKGNLLIQSRALLQIVFPDRKHMEYFIPALEKYPILLPAAWVKRWKIGLENRWKLKAAIHGMGKNVDETKAQYQMLKKIGL